MRWAGALVALLLATPVAVAHQGAQQGAQQGGPQGAQPSGQQVQPSRFALVGPTIQGGVVLGTAPAGTVSLTLDGRPVAVAPDRRFIIGFDRDAPPTATLVATLASGGSVREAVTIAPRAWRIERLNSLPRYGQPTADFLKLRAPEMTRIAAARAIDSDSQGWRQPFLWPATGRLSGLFGAQRVYRGEAGAFHSGVDVARPEGATVIAPADGVVVLAAQAPFTLEGNLLMIDHGMGLNSAFLHLSRIDVVEGQRVRRGQTIGAVGKTGRATGPHLHWGMKWRAARIDPLLLAGPMPTAD